MCRIALATALAGCAVDEVEVTDDESELLACTSPAWRSVAVYPPGSKVTFRRHGYRARRWTQGEQPGRINAGAWEDQGLCEIPIPDAGPSCPVPWNSATVYSVGATVSRDGRAYRAQIWTQGSDPLRGDGSWLDLGPC